MTNEEKILRFLASISPESVSNADIVARTGVRPHQQVFQITQRLSKSGMIQRRLFGKEWLFWAEKNHVDHSHKHNAQHRKIHPYVDTGNLTDSRTFEEIARRIMSDFFRVELQERKVTPVNKKFDFVSLDGSIVGDAKFYSLVKGDRYPPAKISAITEHVWLLEKTNAARKFLVFGNDRRVPEVWLKKYGCLLGDVEFYFISEAGVVELMSDA